MAEVMVRGEGEVRCLPDRAVLQVGIEGEAATQEEAYRLASRAAASVDAVLDRFASAIARRATSGVMVRPKTRWRKGEAIRTAWLAARSTVVEVKDLAQLGPLVGELPAADASAVNGPSWQVDRDNPAYDEARRIAARDARQRAQAYAEALGLRLGALSWVSEPGLRLAGGAHVMNASLARFAPQSRAAGAAEEPMDVSPDEVSITAVVEACFELLDATA